MHSHLLVSQNTLTPTDLIAAGLLTKEPPHVDIYTAPSDGPITIANVREIQRFLHTAPVKLPQKFILLHDAHRLTLPAQHALLKTLEEPPPYAQLILTTHHPDALLDTIVSRCQVHRHHVQLATHPPDPNTLDLISQLSQASLPQRLGLAQGLGSKKGSALTTVTNLTHALHLRFHQTPNEPTASQLSQLLTAHYRLEHNANPLLTLEHLFLHWKL